jgi:hypothetical protein
MNWIYDDGGRALAGFRGSAGDCVARSVAIASGRPYAEVYAALAKIEGSRRGTKKGATARNGIKTNREPFKAYMHSLGFEWTPTMKIGSGCKVHLRADELPSGRLVVSVSKHYTAVIDGVIRDTFDPSDRPATIYCVNNGDLSLVPKGARRMENGQWLYKPERCVYGYWRLT